MLNIKELYTLARNMEYSEFCSFLAKSMGNIQESECPKKFIDNLELRLRECDDERFTEKTDFTKRILNCAIDTEEKLICQVMETYLERDFTKDDSKYVEKGFVPGIFDWYYLRFKKITLGKIIKHFTNLGMSIDFEPVDWAPEEWKDRLTNNNPLKIL